MHGLVVAMPLVRLSRLRPRVWRGILIVAAGLCALVLLAYAGASAYIATDAIRATRHPVSGDPAALGMPYERVQFPSLDSEINLKGWFLPSSSHQVVVMVHGLDGNRSDADSKSLDIAKVLVTGGYNVLMFDLRGHGESSDGQLGLGWTERRDVEGAVAYLEQRGFPPGTIALHGSSYGASIAIFAAAETPAIAAVVADSPFADSRVLLNQEIQSRTGMPPIFMPGVIRAGQLMYGLDLDAHQPIYYVPKLDGRPLLLIHGLDDTRIPPIHSEWLHEAYPNPMDELWLVPGANHTKAFTIAPAEYARRILTFYGRAFARANG